jgi:isoleucyl-tRNA synthetase
MEQCYKELNLHKAYSLTVDYFKNILHEIYIKSVKKRIIAYPNRPENEEHFRVIRKILQLVAVVGPLFPFSAYHISRQQVMQWP